MSDQFQITQARAEDAINIRQLMSQVIRQDVELDTAHLDATLANVNTNVDLWLREPQRCLHLLARRQDQLVGVVLVKDYWNLCSLFVNSACQGQGIGRQLVEEAARLCAGNSPKQALWLNAASHAIPFYRKLGFVERQSTQALPPGFLAMQRPFLTSTLSPDQPPPAIAN